MKEFNSRNIIKIYGPSKFLQQTQSLIQELKSMGSSTKKIDILRIPIMEEDHVYVEVFTINDYFKNPEDASDFCETIAGCISDYFEDTIFIQVLMPSPFKIGYAKNRKS